MMADAHLDDGGWEWHYDTTNPSILTRVVRIGAASTEVNIPNKLDGSTDLLYIGQNCFRDSEGYQITKVLSMPNTVVTISAYAFSQHPALTSIVIGDGVTTIRNEVFYNCGVLASVTFGSSLQIIYDSAFSNCTALVSIVVPDSVLSIRAQAFGWCTSLTTVVIGDGVTLLGQNAFFGCSALNSVVLGTGLITLEAGVFNTTALTSITLPNSLVTIGANQFGNSPLTTITIPAGVTSIGDGAFMLCPALESINVDSSNTIYASVDGVLYNKALTTLYKYPEGRTNASFVIPIAVTTLYERCFAGSQHLTSVTIGTTLTAISDFAFYDCIALTSIVIPSNIATVGIYAFYHCTALASAEIVGNGSTTIGINAFYVCTALYSVIIGDGVTIVSAWAFENCTALQSLLVGNNVSTLGTDCFRGCTSLKTVSLPASISTSFSPFSYCTGLTSVVFRGNIAIIGDYFFYNCPALLSITFEGLVAPTTVGTEWITGTASGIRGHAYPTSDFPVAGSTFYGLMMGDYIPMTFDPSRSCPIMKGITCAEDECVFWEPALQQCSLKNKTPTQLYNEISGYQPVTAGEVMLDLLRVYKDVTIYVDWDAMVRFTNSTNPAVNLTVANGRVGIPILFTEINARYVYITGLDLPFNYIITGNA
jgi:hypothetical protein